MAFGFLNSVFEPLLYMTSYKHYLNDPPASRHTKMAISVKTFQTFLKRTCYNIKFFFKSRYRSEQAWANNLTLPRYSTKTRRFGNYSCMNLWKSRPSYSTRVRVKYLYFRRIWRILVESNPSIRVFNHLWFIVK